MLRIKIILRLYFIVRNVCMVIDRDIHTLTAIVFCCSKTLATVFELFFFFCKLIAFRFRTTVFMPIDHWHWIAVPSSGLISRYLLRTWILLLLLRCAVLKPVVRYFLFLKLTLTIGPRTMVSLQLILACTWVAYFLYSFLFGNRYMQAAWIDPSVILIPYTNLFPHQSSVSIF